MQTTPIQHMLMGNIREQNPEVRRHLFKKRFEKSNQKNDRNLSEEKTYKINLKTSNENIGFLNFKNISINVQRPRSSQKQKKKENEHNENCYISRKKYIEDICKALVQKKRIIQDYCEQTLKGNKITVANCIERKQQSMNKFINVVEIENKNKIRKAFHEKKDDKNFIIQPITNYLMNKISNEAKNKNINEINKESVLSTEEFHNFTFNKIESSVDLNFKHHLKKNSVLEGNGRDYYDIINHFNNKNQSIEENNKKNGKEKPKEKSENETNERIFKKKKINAFVSFFKLCFS